MPNPGDKVKITTDDQEFEGTLMPRPEILDRGMTVLKLENGYNIGIEDEKIKKTDIIEEYKKPKEKTHELKPKKGLPNITIMSTGGTISSKVDYRTGGVYADYTAEDIISMVPELADIANLKAKKIMSVMSEDMDPDCQIKIAEEIAEELASGADGVVITHGTDTLHFTSAAVSFMLQDPGKPVIFTAAQRSIDRGSSDAFLNLICSIKAAAEFNASEVMVCMHGTTDDDHCLLIRGTKVRKMHTSRRDAFRPIDELPLAKVFPDKIDIIGQDFKKRSDPCTETACSMEKKTGLVYVYPGMDPKALDHYIGYKGLVIAGTGLGNVPENILPKLKELADNNTILVMASQALYGKVHPLVYARLRELSIGTGIIFSQEMIPETAYMKLAWALKQTDDKEKVKKIMLKNLAGEISEQGDAKSFLY